ncbi:HAD family hydrolase [Acidobacteriota bacterium]
MRSILFDMDGVLVDVRGSYLVAIQETVVHFSKNGISLEEIKSTRNRGGLNNDWDLCEAVLKDRGVQPAKSEIIAVFQSFYLGSDQAEVEFKGLINREKAFIKMEILGELIRSWTLGVVTGRPRPEAVFTLKKLELWPFFKTCITADDIPTGKGKPDPWGILLALERIGADLAYYVGDTVDDMLAACASGLPAVGIAHDPENRRRQREILRKAGAKAVLNDVNEIMEVIT